MCVYDFTQLLSSVYGISKALALQSIDFNGAAIEEEKKECAGYKHIIANYRLKYMHTVLWSDNKGWHTHILSKH